MMSSVENIDLTLARARTSLVLNHPFFATLALRLELIEDKNCETAWTDGKILAYNPDYVCELPIDELTGLFAHIVMHPVCGHHLRRNNREPLLWNRACDYAINWILIDSGITLPRGFLYSKNFRHKNADEIYEILLNQQRRIRQPESNSNIQGATGFSGLGLAGEQQQSDIYSNELASSPDADFEQDTEFKEQQVDDAPAQTDPGKSGEVRDFDTKSSNGEPLDSENEENQWQIALAQALNQSREMGHLPAALQRLVEDILEPKLDWQDILLRFLEQATINDYSWLPPNRRHIHDGLYLPSVNGQELREIVVVADTSGSISQHDFDFLAVELSSILELKAINIYLLYCDADVVDWHKLTRDDLPFTIEAKGGGGTDFRPAFEWVEEQDIQPSCLIYLSDMVCDKFPQEPDYPVLWGRIGDSDDTPPFGELIEITTELEMV